MATTHHRPLLARPAHRSASTVEPRFDPRQVAEQTLRRRAIEAVNWGMPAVSYDLMYRALARDAGGAFNQIVYWSRPLNWKGQMITPNPDVIYVMPFINTRDAGPIVLEIPAADGGSITGTVMDCWQAALEDVGPAGMDKGRGGRYVILPPGYTGMVPFGCTAMPSDTYQGYALLRSVPKSGSDEDLAKAVAYAERIRLYRLSQASHPPATTFIDATDVVFDATIPYDLRFFQSLDRMVQSEPWLPRDKVMIDMLKSIGIEKGRPFEPDLKTQDILTHAAREARTWLTARYDTAFAPYYAGSQWVIPALPEIVESQATFFERPDVFSLDARGLLYSYAFSSIKHLGAGQFYLLTFRDKRGSFLAGRNGHRLTVPPSVPVRQYWSATVYDRATHAFIRNLPRPGRSSQSPGLQTNADGSVDLYIGPKPPTAKEPNWIPTGTDGHFEVVFRFFGPEPALFDKTWKLPDIERA